MEHVNFILAIIVGFMAIYLGLFDFSRNDYSGLLSVVAGVAILGLAVERWAT